MKLRHFKTKNNFELVLNRGGEIEDVDLCFIKDSGEIWTHGKYYCLIDSEFSDVSGLPLSNSTITDAFMELEESTAAAIDKIRASVGLDQELEYQDTVDNTGSIDEALRVLDNTKLDKSQKGVPGGLATLDQNGKISNSQLSFTVAVDHELSETSENPVQNKVIYATLSEIEEIIAAAINKLKESLGLTRTLDYSGTIEGAVSLDDADKKLHDLIVSGGGSSKNVIIADINTNPELIGIAKTAGWTTEDCLYQYQAEGVTSLSGIDFSSLTHFDELKYFTGVTQVSQETFLDCSSLTSITIPSSVMSIRNYAFSGCTGLTSVTISFGVAYIGYNAFSYCSGLTSIDIPSSVTEIGERAFYSCSGLTSVIIPSSVTSIGNSVFSGCSSLTSIDIPNSVTSIGNSAFSSCSSLTSIKIPSSVTSILVNTFYDCSDLTSIDIPNSVTSIGTYAFFGCSGLTSIMIPSSVTSIGNGVFYNCSSLNCIISLNPVAPTLSGVDTFTGMPNSGTLYHPYGSDYSSWMSELPSGWVSRELVYSEEGKAGGDIEVIIGTHGTTATGAWRGVTRDTALYDGKLICYTSRSAGSGNASLELTFPNGTTTGAIPIFYTGTTRLTTHNTADTPCIFQYRKNTNSWRRMSNYTVSDTKPYQIQNYNTCKAKGAIVANSLIVGDSTGYITAKSGVTFDITYPILYSTTKYNANATFTTAAYYTKYSATLRNNTSSSWTATTYSTVYLVGTLDGTTFTINSTVLTSTIPTTEDGLLYIPIGLMYSTYQAYVFGYQVELYKYYDGKFQKYNGDGSSVILRVW